MADQTVSVALEANVAGFIASMHQAQQAVTSLTSTVSSGMGGATSATQQATHAAEAHRTAMDKVAKGAGIAGAALVGFAALTSKAFADYDAKMTQIQSLTKALPAQMKALERASMSFATSFGVSASQAADAETELVKAGVSVTDIINGGLAGALTLASAGQLDVADATEIAASTMTQFGLAGKDVSHIADLLSAGSDKALGSVGDLGEALKQSGLVASQTGLSLEETTGALSAFASAGLIGSDAGTSFKTMLQALTPQSTQAAAAMEKIGLHAYDAQGNFVGLSTVAGQLKDGLSKLSQEQQAATLKTIFGTDAVRAASVLYQNGADGIAQWTDAVNDQGFAAEQAAGKMNNLKGDLTKLRAAVTNDFIGMGTEANGPLRTVTQRVTDLVEAFGGLSPVVKGSISIVAGSAGFALLAVAGIAKVVKSVREARTAFQALSLTGRQAALAFGGIGLVITAATLGLTAWASKQAAATAETNNLTDALDQQTGAITDNYQKIIASGIANDKVGTFLGLGGDKVIDLAKDMGISASELQNAILKQGTALDQVNAKMQTYGATTTKNAGPMLELQGYVEDQVKAVNDSKAAWEDANEAQGGLNEQTKDLDTQTQALTTSIQKQTAAAQDSNSAVSDWADNVAKSGSSFIDVSKNIDGAKLSLQGWIDQIKQQAKDEADWNTNLLKIAKRGGSQELLTQLSKLGPEGASYVKQLADGSKTNISDLNKAFKDADQSAADLTAGLEDLNAAKPQPVTLTVDSSNALATISALSATAATANATITIDGDDGPVTSKAKGVSAKIDEMAGTVTILGSDGKAVQTLTDYTASVDNATGSVSITGTDSKGRTVVTAFTKWTDAQGAAVKITADTSAATRALGQLNSLIGATGGSVHLGVTPVQKAAGGQVVGPGSATSDSVPALLSNGEHVLTASDVAKMGGQSAVYRMRAMVQAGLMRFAKGGAVESARTAKDSAYAAWKAHRKSKDADDYRQKYEDARDKYTALVESQAKARTAARRGDYRSSVTSGLDSAYGVIDDVITASKDSNLTKSQRSSLAKAAKEAEPALKSLYKQADGLQAKLDKATDNLSRLKDVASAAANTVKGVFDLSAAYVQATDATTEQVERLDQFGNTYYDTKTTAGTAGGYTAAGVLAAGASQAALATTFATGLSTLQGKLGSGAAAAAITQQALTIFGNDPEAGVSFVNALLSMSTRELGTLKSDYTTIAKAGTSAGSTAASADTAGGLAKAQHSADDLATSLDKVNKSIATWGTTLTNAALRPYGLKLDSKGNVVKRASGGWVTGPGTSTSDSIHLAASSGEFVVNAQAATANAALLEKINATRAPYQGAGVPARAGTSVVFQVQDLHTDSGVDAAARAFMNRATDLVNAFGLAGIGAAS